MTDQQALLATTATDVKVLIAHKVAELIAAGNPNPTVGLVPTMGALHEGHGALFEQARRENDLVVASIFVNPLQFDQPEDFEHYPRDLAADLELVTKFGGDIVFAPSTEHMYPWYPDAPQIRVSAGQMGRMFEGHHVQGTLMGLYRRGKTLEYSDATGTGGLSKLFWSKRCPAVGHRDQDGSRSQY